MRNNPNADLVNINAYAKFGQIPSICLKILSGNEILTSIKGHNSVINLQKWTHTNHYLGLVIINAYAIFGHLIPSICSQDIDRKRNSGINHGT